MDNNNQTTGAENTQDQAIKKVELTQEQIDNLVRNAMGRAGREAKEAAEAASNRVKELETELEELRSTKTTQPTTTGDASDLDALKAQIEEMRSAKEASNKQFERLKKEKEELEKSLNATKDEALNVRKRVAMQEAAAELGFLDLDDVLNLTHNFVRWDSNNNKFIVVNEQGAPRMNTMYEEMSLKEFYNEYAGKKPHLVKSTHRSGTGASGSNTNPEVLGAFQPEKVFGKGSDAKLAMKLKSTNPKEYTRLKELAKSQGLI